MNFWSQENSWIISKTHNKINKANMMIIYITWFTFGVLYAINKCCAWKNYHSYYSWYSAECKFWIGFILFGLDVQLSGPDLTHETVAKSSLHVNSGIFWCPISQFSIHLFCFVFIVTESGSKIFIKYLSEFDWICTSFMPFFILRMKVWSTICCFDPREWSGYQLIW